MGRAVWRVGLVATLCTLQCAKLDYLGSDCGNGAVDPIHEDCDGASFGLAPSGNRLLVCGKVAASACRFVCGKDSQCPSDDWACKAGVCIKIPDGFTAPGLDVLGPAGSVKSVDFDANGTDDVLVEPLDVNAPYIAYFGIADPAKAKAQTLFPAGAMCVADAPRGEGAEKQARATLVASFDDGMQVTMARARESGEHNATTELEPLSFASAEVRSAGIDFLYSTRYGGNLNGRLTAWVHGGDGEDDTLSSFDYLQTRLLSMRAPVDTHRIVTVVPADAGNGCLRLAIFTRGVLSPDAGSLQILTPDSNCTWAKYSTRLLEGHYPASRGHQGVFVADLDGDGVNDLIVNARKATPAGSQTESFVLRGPLDGQLVPLLDDTSLPNGAQSVVIAAATVKGYKKPALLTCQRYGTLNPDGLCLSESGRTLSVLLIRFPNDAASAYPTRETLALDPLVAGFSDLNGDGQDDVWAWSQGSTGPRIFAATPSGFFSTGLVEHRSSTPLGITSIMIDKLPRDIIALTESTDSSAGLESAVLVTRGNRVASQLNARQVARVAGRAQLAAFEPTYNTTPALIPLVACTSADCDPSPDSRKIASFDVTTLRPLASQWLASPSLLWCGTAVEPHHFFTDHPHVRAQVSAFTLTTTSGRVALEPDTRALTVSAGRYGTSAQGQFFGARLRWGRLRAGRIPDQLDCTQEISRVTESVAVAPMLAASDPRFAGSDVSLLLATYSQRANSPFGEFAGRAFAVSPSASPKTVSIVPEPAFGGYRAIYAEAHDVDGDGDNDFIVLERERGIDGDRTRARPVLYMNVPCESSGSGRCLFVKNIVDTQGKTLDRFDAASGEGLALSRSPTDGGLDKVWREWWLASIRQDVDTKTGMTHDSVVTQRIRAVGTDDTIAFDTTSERHELTPLQLNAQNQHLAWGDFDGDGVLDLLYASDKGSRLHRRE